MPKIRNHYQVLGEAKPCYLLKTSTNLSETNYSQVSQNLQTYDGCVLHDDNLFYINQYKKTCTKITNNADFYMELFRIMNTLPSEEPTLASHHELELITFATDHALTLNATTEEIKKAYKSLALIHHPDRPSGNENKFKILDTAYIVLSDPIQRRGYDLSISGHRINQRSQGMSWSTWAAGLHPFQHLQTTNPARYAEIVNPNADFTAVSDNFYYHLRAVYYSPCARPVCESNNIRSPLSSSPIISSRTLKSYNKHFRNIFITGEEQFSQERINSPFYYSLPRRLSLFERVTEGRFHPEYSIDYIDEIKKFIFSTFLPYHSSQQIIADFLRPFHALWSLLLAFIPLLSLIVSLIALPFDLFYRSIDLIKNEFITALTDLAMFAIIGVIELITTPLTWFIQMPIRSFCNLASGGWGYFSDNYHIQRLVNEAEKAIAQDDKLAIITSTALLHRKFLLNTREQFTFNQRNHSDPAEETKLYNILDRDFVLGTLNIRSTVPVTAEQKNHLTSYIGLFKKPRPAQNNEKSPELSL